MIPRPPSFPGEKHPAGVGAAADQRPARFRPELVGPEPARPADCLRRLGGEGAAGEATAQGNDLFLKVGTVLTVGVFNVPRF